MADGSGVRSRIAVTVLCLACSVFGVPDAGARDLAAAKREMVRQSVASYPGRCPCPWNSARNGSSCGRRSAYSRAGGASPFCYEADVPDEAASRFLGEAADPVPPVRASSASALAGPPEAVAAGWVLKGATAAGVAWISRAEPGSDVLEVRAGDFLPSLGEVLSVRREADGWAVATRGGTVRP